jgi:hypothetical protein
MQYVTYDGAQSHPLNSINALHYIVLAVGPGK